MTREQPLKIKEFAHALNICTQEARYMARSEVFKRYKISVDIACAGTLPTYKHSKGRRTRRNKKWRIYMSRYEDALHKGLLTP